MCARVRVCYAYTHAYYIIVYASHRIHTLVQTASGWLSGKRVRLSRGRSWVRAPVFNCYIKDQFMKKYKLFPILARIGYESDSAV